MTGHVIVRPQPAHRHHRRRVGEVAGGATADCAAVCCCCPCAVLNFVVLAAYTVPKGLLRKAVHRRRRCLTMKNSANGIKNDVVLLQTQRSLNTVETKIVGPTLLEEHLEKERAAEEKSEAVELEKEMWAQFAGTGFWRSESQHQP